MRRVRVEGQNVGCQLNTTEAEVYIMSRPKPTILAEHSEGLYRSDQVLASDGIWAVFYKNRPINLRSINTLISYPGPKYRKVSFSNPGHACNLARKLNDQFSSQEFTVVLLDTGTQIYP